MNVNSKCSKFLEFNKIKDYLMLALDFCKLFFKNSLFLNEFNYELMSIQNTRNRSFRIEYENWA